MIVFSWFSFAAMSSAKNIYYSDKYFDEKFEYRHVMLPKDIAKQVPKTHLMSESEWRKLGVQQSQVSPTLLFSSSVPCYFAVAWLQ